MLILIEFNQKSQIIFVEIHQIFSIFFVPFYKSNVHLTTKLRLVQSLDDNKYYIKSQEDLYQSNEVVKFFWPGGATILWFWQISATGLCILGALLLAPMTWLEQRHSNHVNGVRKSLWCASDQVECLGGVCSEWLSCLYYFNREKSRILNGKSRNWVVSSPVDWCAFPSTSLLCFILHELSHVLFWFSISSCYNDHFLELLFISSSITMLVYYCLKLPWRSCPVADRSLNFKNRFSLNVQVPSCSRNSWPQEVRQDSPSSAKHPDHNACDANCSEAFHLLAHTSCHQNSLAAQTKRMHICVERYLEEEQVRYSWQRKARLVSGCCWDQLWSLAGSSVG